MNHDLTERSSTKCKRDLDPRLANIAVSEIKQWNYEIIEVGCSPDDPAHWLGEKGNLTAG